MDGLDVSRLNMAHIFTDIGHDIFCQLFENYCEKCYETKTEPKEGDDPFEPFHVYWMFVAPVIKSYSGVGHSYIDIIRNMLSKEERVRCITVPNPTLFCDMVDSDEVKKNEAIQNKLYDLYVK